LTVEERQQLEALVRSTKCKARMRFRAQIVLLAAAGQGRGRSAVSCAARSARRRSGAADLDSFIADYNEYADPFVWTKSAVHQKTLKPCFAVQ
jgi:hypothetical protein